MIEYIKQNPELTGVVISAIISAIISFLISSKSSYITAVTAERSKWIDKLRENIAELLSVCSTIHISLPDTKSPDALVRHEKADRLIALIMMQLNPRNKIDKSMISLLPKLIQSSENKNGGYRAIEREFVCHAQFLLKEEWEKVKLEGGGSLLPLHPIKYFKYWRRRVTYQNFCNGKLQ